MKKKSSLKSMGHHEAKHTPTEKGNVEGFIDAFECSALPLGQRLQNFPRHVRRQDIARFLTKYEIFQRVLTVNGNIVECGVFAGGGLASWLHFSSILEPFNHTRKIIGFDTFDGFPEIHAKDLQGGTSDHLHKNAFRINTTIKDEIKGLAALHDSNRPLGHLPKVELIEGDACKTIPQYVDDNPSLLISLLYLDFDIYAPTKVALEHLYPRIVKGGIVAFDELNCPEFPGETVALLEHFDLERIELRRTVMDPHISYFIK
ncbi:MAG: class I SAM-dependent methyltransferase [Verrucomicrobia bacterium]|nr:MAG: class I SAM-dependent methyltransferase [Verrucomicrobiota bacterium]